MNRIRAKGITDNVVDLMTGRLGRLPAGALQIMKCLACLGNSAQTSTLGMVVGQAEEEIHAVLMEGVRTGLIFHLESGYAFAHDRVREAAYALISEDERAASHLHIGRVLASETPSEALEEKIFEIVNQFDRATALIATAEEREQGRRVGPYCRQARQILNGLCVGTGLSLRRLRATREGQPEATVRSHLRSRVSTRRMRVSDR
jgi:predicted ATPase